MIPRTKQTRFHRHDKTQAFARGDEARALRIYIDSATTPDSDALQVLLDFAAHEQVEVVTTDGRSPIDLTIGAYDQHHHYTSVEINFPDGRRMHTGVPGPDIQGIGREFLPGDPDEGERQAVLAVIADEQGSDALVTESDLLLNALPRNIVEGANPMTPETAVALLGLFLRVREDFVFYVSQGGRMKFDRGLFYWVLMRELLPSAWRWFSACVSSSTNTKDDTILLVAQSALERTERALRARDRMHERLQLTPNRDSVTEAIFYFDVTLLMLGGAFDGLARVAHITHSLKGSPRSASWGSKEWLKKLGNANKPLADAMQPEQPFRDARELVAALRNTIHSMSLRTVTHQALGRRDELVLVPSDIAPDLEAVVNRLRTADEFGVTREADQRLYIRPGTYVEVALPIVAEALNGVMDLTPVAQLPGVDPAFLTTGPPTDRNDNVWAPDIRAQIWRLGGIG